MKILILTQALSEYTILLKSDSFISAIDLGDKREVFYHIGDGIRMSYFVKDTIYDIELQLKRQP